MKSQLNARSFGTIVLLGFFLMLPLFTGCWQAPDSPGIAERVIENLCENYQREETLVQKIRQKRMQIADEFRRDRTQANSRATTD